MKRPTEFHPKLGRVRIRRPRVMGAGLGHSDTDAGALGLTLKGGWYTDAHGVTHRYADEG